MIDYFAIALTHGLLALAAWRLLSRADLNDENAARKPKKRKPWLKQDPAPVPAGEGDGGEETGTHA